MGIMTASAFIRPKPRQLLVRDQVPGPCSRPCWRLWNLGDTPTGVYSRGCGSNDDLSFYARLVLLLAAFVLLAAFAAS